MNSPIVHTVFLAVATLIIGISGRTLLDRVLSHGSGPATIALWAQLSSVIDLISAVACAGLGPGVTVLVARSRHMGTQDDILRTAVILGLACSAATLTVLIGFKGLGGRLQVLDEPGLRGVVLMVGLLAATPALAMQTWQSQGHSVRSLMLTASTAVLAVTAASMAPTLLQFSGMALGVLAPWMVLGAALTVSVPLTAWYCRTLPTHLGRILAAMIHPLVHDRANRGARGPSFAHWSHVKSLLTYLPAGLSIGLLSPLSLIAAREIMAQALGWEAVASVQAIWRCADWVAALVSGMLSLVFLPRMSRAISALEPSRALRRELWAAVRWLWIPAAFVLGIMISAGPHWLVGLFGLSVVPSSTVFATFLLGEWVRMGSWIVLYALFATGAQRAIAVGELCSLPLFAGLLWLIGPDLSLHRAALAYLGAYLTYLAFNLWVIRISVGRMPSQRGSDPFQRRL